MEYLTLKINSEARGLIYEKDFNSRDVFGPFVQVLVSNLVKVGFLKENQLYWSVITPCFDNQPQLDPVLSESASAGDAPQNVGKHWLTLVIPKDARPDAPINYFTVELHTQPPEAKTYRKSFPVVEVDYLVKRVKTGLQQLGMIRVDEAVRADLYARSGDTPRFNEEIVHALPEELSDLHIQIEEAAPEESFPEREMPRCACGHIEDESTNQLLIFFKENCLKRLGEFMKQNASREEETGGLLIGEVFRQVHSQRMYLEIEDFLPAQQTLANTVSLRFTHETFRTLREQKAKQYADNKLIVGWYHTHPPVPLTVGKTQVHTTSFFSGDDLDLHRRIFCKSWQVALVMDAESREKIFYRWAGESVVESGFHVSE